MKNKKKLKMTKKDEERLRGIMHGISLACNKVNAEEEKEKKGETNDK